MSSITPYGEWHYRELEVFIKDIGMTNLEAITCATKNAAKSIKMENKVGTIEKGMLADILVVDGDPLVGHHQQQGYLLAFLFQWFRLYFPS